MSQTPNLQKLRRDYNVENKFSTLITMGYTAEHFPGGGKPFRLYHLSPTLFTLFSLSTFMTALSSHMWSLFYGKLLDICKL